MFNAYNTNGGHWTANGWSWTNVAPPFPNTAGDPYTACDSVGNLYYITLNSSVTLSYVIKSTNMGQSWGTAVTSCTGNDRETISADQSGGPYKGYVYCGETPGNFARSTDGGASFVQTASMSDALPGFISASGPGPTGISGGAVYVCTSTGGFATPTYTLYRSTDGGASFTLMSTQNGWVNTVGTQVGGRNSYQNMRLRPYPFMYADNTFGAFRGRLYIFYAANNPPGDGNKPDVYIRYSTDGGATFSAPTTINDDGGTGNAQFQEQGYVDKITGNLYCQWMDTRNCPTGDSSQIFASMSTNGGITWSTNLNLSTAKFRINCPTCGGGGAPAYQGDYSGLSAYGNISVPAWTDFRAGTFGSYTAYFPDYAMKINNNNIGCQGGNDSCFTFVSVPSNKQYTDKVKFSLVSISPPPGTGSITISFLSRTSAALLDTLSASSPDSIRIRAKTTGGVPNGFYTVTVQGNGRALPNAPFTVPVHQRTFVVNVGLVGVTPRSNEVPAQYSLFQNYPNPFNPSTQIRFDIPKSGLVKICVYDITGKKVTELANSYYNAGKYSVDFNATDYSSGVYFYKIEAADFTSIKKMIVLK